MKKVLILTVTAGNGHNACAKALKNKLEAMGDVQVKVIDVVKKYGNRFDAWVVDKGYNFAVSKLPWVYDLFYNHFMKYRPNQRYNYFAQKVALGIVDGLYREILQFKPDVVYSSHFYGAIAISDIRLKYYLPCKVIVSCLDYVYSPFWQAGIGVDYFTVPNIDFVEQGKMLGFEENKLLPIGIPVNEKIYNVLSKEEALDKLALPKDAPTILVMFGGGFWSGGYKIFKTIIKSLDGQNVNVIMINGRNVRDYKKIEKKTFDKGINVVNVGFTDNMPLYMAAADFVVNKCGGISSTEILNMSLPMLVTERIPSQEKYNLKYLKERGVAISFKNKKELAEKLNLLLKDEFLRINMSKNTNYFKNNSIYEIANLILDLPKAEYLQEDGNINYMNIKKEIKNLVRQNNKISRRKYENSSSNR